MYIRKVPHWKTLGFPSCRTAVKACEGRCAGCKAYFSEQVCVANYEAGTALLRLTGDAVYEHGFDTWHDDETGKIITRYVGLNTAWALEVRKRQRAAA